MRSLEDSSISLSQYKYAATALTHDNAPNGELLSSASQQQAERKMEDGLQVRTGQCSQAGRKISNEDSCGIHIPSNYLLHTKGIAAIVADGVSSADAGREASEACVQGFLQDYYSTPESWTTKTSAQKVLGALNRWLYGRSVHQINSRDLGFASTFSALIFKSTSVYFFHVGDTRIYRWRHEQLEQLTTDHRLVSGGGKTFLSHAMGVDPKLQIDYGSKVAEKGDTYLLMTDGVHDFVSNKTLKKLLSTHQEPQELAEKIVEQAFNNNSDDNISCQIINITQLPFHDDEDAFYRQLVELPFPPPLTSNMAIDGFSVLRELHASKRTHVYLAEDTETKEKVVIKCPSINYSDDAGFIDNFLHEEWVGRRISNSHVLKTLEHPRKRQFLYYLTEHCAGQTLRQWMVDNPHPPLNKVRDIVNQIMQGVLAFHRLEMVHQDLKPENIVVDDNGTVKIIDFGSTKIAGIEEIAKPYEKLNDALGTVNYSASELMTDGRGSAQSDLYSVGVIAYEMLTGELPYGEVTSVKKLLRTDYKKASEYRDNLPIWVDGALRKAVQHNQQQRYQLLSEFVYDLSHPNSEYIKPKFEPLIERNPIQFWKLLAATALAFNIVLLYLLFS